MILLQTVVSEFSSRFVQTERASIVQLVTFLSYIMALVMVVKLVRMLQRGDHHFNVTFWRWCMGILFTLLFPNFLSMIILKKEVGQVIMAAPTTPVVGEDSGYLDEAKMQEWVNSGEAEKGNLPASPLTKPNYNETELGGTVIDPDASPEDYGEDIDPNNP